jgi:hypothetical protein
MAILLAMLEVRTSASYRAQMDIPLTTVVLVLLSHVDQTKIKPWHRTKAAISRA